MMHIEMVIMTNSSFKITFRLMIVKIFHNFKVLNFNTGSTLPKNTERL